MQNVQIIQKQKANNVRNVKNCSIWSHHFRVTNAHSRAKRKINSSKFQGLGINDPESTDIITHVCRFNFPRFPLHKTCVLLSFSKNDDPKMVFEAKKDLKHIKQYLIRQGGAFRADQAKDRFVIDLTRSR